MVFNTTFNNISAILWWSVLLVEETGVHGENHSTNFGNCVSYVLITINVYIVLNVHFSNGQYITMRFENI
jgi:hypothetical protein